MDNDPDDRPGWTRAPRAPPPIPIEVDSNTPPATVSRYRSLRGKSISSPRSPEFDVFREPDLPRSPSSATSDASSLDMSKGDVSSSAPPTTPSTRRGRREGLNKKSGLSIVTNAPLPLPARSKSQKAKWVLTPKTTNMPVFPKLNTKKSLTNLKASLQAGGKLSPRSAPSTPLPHHHTQQQQHHQNLLPPTPPASARYDDRSQDYFEAKDDAKVEVQASVKSDGAGDEMNHAAFFRTEDAKEDPCSKLQAETPPPTVPETPPISGATGTSAPLNTADEPPNPAIRLTTDIAPSRDPTAIIPAAITADRQIFPDETRPTICTNTSTTSLLQAAGTSHDVTTSPFLVNGTTASDRNSPGRSPLDAPTLEAWQKEQQLLRDAEERKEAVRWASEVARLEAETDRILAEQKKRDLARLQLQLANAPARSLPATPKPKTAILLERFTFLARAGGTAASSSSSSSSAIKKANAPASTLSATNSKGAAGHASFYSLAYSSTATDTNISPTTRFHPPVSPLATKMTFLDREALLPQVDAPKAAVNGGERRVTVRCLSSTINLPVTPETSPIDIVYSTANLTPHNINLDASVVVECYVVLGLERRLRRYERIRDVMNSWDRDQQNSLLLLSYESTPDDKDLHISSVPRSSDPPPGFTVHMYVSSRPGKWTKRWITLLDSGQIFSAKKPDAKPTDKDSAVLCHLSDFDIYTPRESEQRRHLKPPKKHCYAIKSQQKTVVFPDGENFVHFFSTDDAALAERFHELVHGWRSWYLVNKKVDISHKDTARDVTLSPQQKAGGLNAPYLIGEFQPLIDMQRFEKTLEEATQNVTLESSPPAKEVSSPTASVKTSADTAQSPSSSRGGRRTLSKRAPPVPFQMPKPFEPTEEFAAEGLLGDAYEKRKEADKFGTGHVKNQAVDDGPFTKGPSLLNQLHTSPRSSTEEKKAKPEASSWFPSATEHTARERSRTITNHDALRKRPTVPRGGMAPRGKPQPLLNLADTSSKPQGAPQWREKPGHGVKATGKGPLINFATGGAAGSEGSQYASAAPAPPFRGGVPRSSSGGLAGSAATSRSADPSGPSRGRSRSTASGTGRRVASDRQHGMMPPAPPMPPFAAGGHSSRRREGGSGGGGSRDKRQEPLINRAG